ncbi:MAG: DedA family protein [Proteobacteria bacterium]|nr:MAG: DedA family protein [Pseudomonadota bacterium]
MLTLGLVFATTFLLLNATGVVTVAKIEIWLTLARDADPLWVAPIIALLLFVDLIISVPTLATITFSGYFLGPVVGALAGIAGLMMAGLGGYCISHRYGDLLLKVVIKEEAKRSDAVATFQEHGAVVILLSRASPMLPEVCACMAGMTRMPLGKFLVLWLASSVPYAAIAAYAGSISSLDNPQPAIFAAIGLMSFLWISWLVVRRRGQKRQG